MKKTLLSCIICLMAASSASTQNLKLWKNGKCINTMNVTAVDSITFANDSQAGDVNWDKLVGTWRVVYSKNYDLSGNLLSERDSELSNNYYVVTADKNISYMSYTRAITGWWNEQAQSAVAQKNGAYVSEGEMEGELVSKDDNTMTFKYKYQLDGNTKETRVCEETLKLFCRNTNVLRSDDNPLPERPETLPHLTADDIVGTWLITHEKGIDYEYKKEWDENVAKEQNYYLFLPDGRSGFLENNDDGTWHLDGGEYINYSIEDNGTLRYPGGYITEFSGNKAKVMIEYIKDVNADSDRTMLVTLQRASKKTDYIKYEE